MVSNPFKTGRYCVGKGAANVRPCSVRFKPLQNGAVLRRLKELRLGRQGTSVSNPFKTGRYCVVPVGTHGMVWYNDVSNPFKTGRYCVVASLLGLAIPIVVSNPFKTGRYCVGNRCISRIGGCRGVSNPFKTGRYCVEAWTRYHSRWPGVSNPFKTGRYCVDRWLDARRKRPVCFKPLQNGAVLRSDPRQMAVNALSEFQTPSKRGGTA